MAYTTIKKPSDYFNTVLYTGNSSTQSITGVGFQPDWVWCKSRSGDNHAIFDSVRGGQKQLRSNTTDAELTRTNAISSFDSDGWSMGSQPEMNSSGATYASWSWLGANGTASNTDGSITSTVSANTTSGFSIVSYTANGTAGATVGHGLGAVPKMIIVKSRTSVDSWIVYHVGNTSAPETDYLSLNTTDATADDAIWNDTAPTSSVFSLGTNAPVNGSGKNLIAYCFAEKKGFSKFGSYTGNGSTDGTFVYTGFKPAFLMIKCFDNARSWVMWDTKRNPYNLSTYGLLADTNDTENSGYNVDLLSNGFKLRTTGSGENGSGFNYIYMAFAEEPLVGDNPATAR